MSKREFKYPLDQFYDGNNPSVGHLYEQESGKSLCGRKKEDMSHPVLENEFEQEIVKQMSWVTFSLEKTCIKCSTIALSNEC